MKIFKRKVEKDIEEVLFKGKAILIFGPRQAGKTTLSKKLIKKYKDGGEYFNCELVKVRDAFVLGEPDKLKKLIGKKKIVVFDEAQSILNIGAILKTFIDTYPKTQIIATGSSSFDLANKINEPLTGRTFEFILMPLSLEEIYSVNKNHNKAEILELMKTGFYPEVVGENNITEKNRILKNITTNYLYKDVFVFESIKNPLIFEKLIKMLSLQIGQMVSVNELSKSLGVSRLVIDKYLRLLEQSFIIKRVNSFSKNKRNELKKAFKIYFLDLGIRNALIDDLTEVENRKDKGSIFENFVFLELLKKDINIPFPPEIFFWRTETKLEIDFIIYKNQKIKAIEVKWGSEKFSFNTFLNTYKDAETELVALKDFIN